MPMRRMTTPVRRTEFFTGDQDAERRANAFCAALPAEADAVVVCVHDPEDKARGYSQPRVWGFSVAFYHSPAMDEARTRAFRAAERADSEAKRDRWEARVSADPSFTRAAND